MWYNFFQLTRQHWQAKNKERSTWFFHVEYYEYTKFNPYDGFV